MKKKKKKKMFKKTSSKTTMFQALKPVASLEDERCAHIKRTSMKQSLDDFDEPAKREQQNGSIATGSSRSDIFIPTEESLNDFFKMQ